MAVFKEGSYTELEWVSATGCIEEVMWEVAVVAGVGSGMFQVVGWKGVQGHGQRSGKNEHLRCNRVDGSA